MTEKKVVHTKAEMGDCAHNPNEFEIVEMFSYVDVFSQHSHIGKHKRRTKGKEYVSPRIVLPSDFNKYIGEAYLPFYAKLKTPVFPGEEIEAIVLVIVPYLTSVILGAETRSGGLSRAGKRELKALKELVEKLGELSNSGNHKEADS